MERRIDPPPVSNSADSEAALAAYWAGLEAACDELQEQEGIDAFMLTTQLIQPQQRAQAFIQRFHEAGVPVFIQTGEPLVEVITAELRRRESQCRFLETLDLPARLRLAPVGQPVGAIGAAMAA